MLNSVKLTTQKSYIFVQSKLQSISQWVTALLDDGKQKSTIASLDGVRAFACICVVVFHLNFAARAVNVWHPIHDLGSLVGAVALAGQSGVALFFILSGFLLFMPFAKAMLFGSTWPSARLFYLRRAFRILPAYYVSLLILILLSHPEYLQVSHWKEMGLFLSFFMDVPGTYQSINGPYWTLAVEVQFYMLLPLLALGISWLVRSGSPQQRMVKVMLCLVGVMVWGLLSRYWGNYFLTHPSQTLLVPRVVINVLLPFVYGNAGKYLEVFAVGMFISTYYIFAKNTDSESRWNLGMRRFSPILWGIGLALLCFMALWHFYTWYFNYTMHFFDPYRELLVQSYDEWSQMCYAIGFGLCVLATLFGPAYIKRPSELAPIRWLGLISYSLYIWHDPLLIFFQTHIIGIYTQQWSRIVEYSLFWGWTLLLIIPISLLSFLFIEKPWISIGERVRRKVKVSQFPLR